VGDETRQNALVRAEPRALEESKPQLPARRTPEVEILPSEGARLTGAVAAKRARGKPGSIWFLAVVFLGAWPVQLALVGSWVQAGLLGAAARPLLTTLVGLLLMWPPALAVVVAHRLEGGRWRDLRNLFRFRRGTGRWFLVAWLCPLGLFALSVLPLLFLREGVPRDVLSGEQTSEPGMGPLALHVAWGISVGPFFNAIFAIGEEWGWRGYLLPRMVRWLGLSKGLSFHAALWGLWQLPVAMLVRGPTENPLRDGALYFLFCFGFGVLLGWLWGESKSFWPPALAHATLMAFNDLLPLLSPSGDNALVGSPWSPLGLVLLAALLAWLGKGDRLSSVERAAQLRR
jgi:membrane protease YdiL (CAAX protease family)